MSFFSLAHLCCEENQPQYTLSRPEVGERAVVVEEFSGARCPNCPQGTQELENLKDIYGDQLIIVTIHAGDFAFTYNDSKYDFTTREGNDLLGFLGNPVGYPSAVVNRIKDQNSQSFQSFSTKWGSLISDAVSVPPIISLTLEHTYDVAQRSLVATVRILPNQDINEEVRLTVLLKESNIIDPQADRAATSGVVSDYNHKNVLRKILSEFRGDLVATNAVALQPIEKMYSYSIPEETGWWKAENLTLVAFVSANGGEIWQGAEKSIIP